MYNGDNGYNYYSAEEKINNVSFNNIIWQQPHNIDCGSYLPRTDMNNEEKSDQENRGDILKTALTYGSALALKTYQDVMVPNNTQCPINSTTSNNQFLQDWNNTCAEKDSSSSLPQNQKLMMPAMYNNQFSMYNNPQWKPYNTIEAFSSLGSNDQQLTIPVTYSNNNNPFSPEWNDTYAGIESIDPNISYAWVTARNDISKRYQQQNVQNNYGQNQAYAEFNNYINNTCVDPLTVSNPVMQCHQSMQHTIHLMEKSKRGRKKQKPLTCTGNTLGQERRTRQTYSSEQTLMLEQAFKANEYVSLKMRMRLADQTNLTGNQIKTWFQNRRMKEKKNRENNQVRPSETNTAPIHGRQASTLSDQIAQPQLQPVVQHHEGYQNYSYSYQQNDVNQPSCFSNSASSKINHPNTFSCLGN